MVAGVVVIIIAVIWLGSCLNVLREYERAVVFRLGRIQTPDKGPGLIFILWPIDKLVRISLRIVAWDVPPQDIITRDNIPLKVNAVVYFRVINAQKAVLELENYRYAIEQLAQTTLRSVLGEIELDDLLSQREKLNLRLQTILDEHTEPWGVKVAKVEVRQVDLPQELQGAIARQAEAERERRAKIINADGEYQAAEKLRAAAQVMEQQPISITLRYLQTLQQIGVEKNTTIVFPLPLDLLAGWIPAFNGAGVPTTPRSLAPVQSTTTPALADGEQSVDGKQ
jgi:regulator of protease activity HflC (stomatin/prohibitin superfamily)